MPTTQRDQLSANLQMHAINIQCQQVLHYYNRGTTPPRAYITEQEATRIQKQKNGMAERWVSMGKREEPWLAAFLGEGCARWGEVWLERRLAKKLTEEDLMVQIWRRSKMDATWDERAPFSLSINFSVLVCSYLSSLFSLALRPMFLPAWISFYCSSWHRLFNFLLNLHLHVHCFHISSEHRLILGNAQLVVHIQSWVEH
jgi:hypothetical protein